MTELVAELDAATNLLDTALNRYLEACSAVWTCYTQASAVAGTPWTFSGRIVDELVSFSTHEAKLEQAGSILTWVKNCPISIAPINALPPEILSRIFLFARRFSDQTETDNIQAGNMPRYPELLSHVCSHWRRIAIDFPLLWTRIDLVYYHSTAPSYAARAKVFATRARHLFLNIHVHAPATLDYLCGIDELVEFLPMVAARTGSLALTRSSALEDVEPASGILALLLDFLEPSTLRQLNLTEHCEDEPSFIYATNKSSDAGPGYDCQRLIMSRERFESALLPVQILRLNGLHPYWASRAYHGLTELYLERASGRSCHVSTAQLHSIFLASPGLVVLHIELPVLDSDEVQGIEPAHLEDLEVLNTSGLRDSDHLETLLGLFTPGQKGLQVTMNIDKDLALFRPNAAVTKFLKRSNVEKLHMIGLHTPIIIDDLLSLVPRLRTLALRGYGTDMSVSPFTSTGSLQHADPPVTPKIDTLYLLRGYFDLQSLRLISKICSPRTIVLWGTNVWPEAARWERDASAFDENVEREHVKTTEDVHAAMLGDDKQAGVIVE